MFGLCNYNHEVYETGVSLRNTSLGCFISVQYAHANRYDPGCCHRLECACVVNTKMSDVFKVEYCVMCTAVCVNAFMELLAHVCS